jgi:hypothetical protein
MFTYSDNTNNSLNSYAFYCFYLIEISFIPVPDVSGDPDEFRVLTITAPSFDEAS